MRSGKYGDLIKFSVIFTKITLELHQNSEKLLFKCKKLVINTTKCDVCLSVVRWSENSVRFEKKYGNWLPDGPNSVRYCMYVASHTFS